MELLVRQVVAHLHACVLCTIQELIVKHVKFILARIHIYEISF